MVREIVTDIDKLSDKSTEVDVIKDNALLRQVTLDLKHTIRENNLVSLTAPQIGENIRVCCINFNGDIRTFVNPVITNVKGFELSREVCPSLPGKTFIRPRNNQIEIAFQTPLGKIETTKLVGLSAKVFQECVDHLDGLLLCDVGLEIDADFDNATPEERDEIILMYLDSLDIRKKQLDKEIQNDKELKDTSDAIKFMESVQEGKTELKSVPLTEAQLNKKNSIVKELSMKSQLVRTL